MKASYEIKREAEIEVVSLDPTQDDFLDDATVSTYVNNGNLGTVRVKTNSTGWDVAFVTSFGGKLATVEKTLDSTQSGYDFAAGKPTFDYFYNYGTPQCLTYTSTTATGGAAIDGLIKGGTEKDTVQLVVAIGMSEKVDGGVLAQKGLKLGQAAVPYNASKVTESQLTSSQSTSATGAAQAGTAVSFASILTTATTGVPASTTTIPITCGGRTVVAGTPLTTPKGFGPTNAQNIKDNPDSDGSEYFYVNVGLPTARKSGIGGNIDGVYEETFTFTLVANF
jgi:hypothetical protein